MNTSAHSAEVRLCVDSQTHNSPLTRSQPRLALTLQRPSQSSAVTPTELISHGSAVHLLPQTLDAGHIMLTRNTITSACLHFFFPSSTLLSHGT